MGHFLGLHFPLAFAVVIVEFVVNVAAITYTAAVVDDAGGAAGTEPFDIAYVRHFNSGLDAVLKNLESYGPG